MNSWSEQKYSDKVQFTTPLPSEEFLRSFDPETARILDVGCGYGRTLGYLETLGYHHLTGVDPSPHLIQVARSRCAVADLLVGDIETADLKGPFDLIILMGVIEYVLTDKAQKQFFKKIKNLVRPDGTVFLETFTLDIGLNWKQYLKNFRNEGHFGRFINSEGHPCHHQTINTLKEILKEYFELLQVNRTQFRTWSDNYANGCSFVMRPKLS